MDSATNADPRNDVSQGMPGGIGGTWG
jgi:hypothetical protein